MGRRANHPRRGRRPPSAPGRPVRPPQPGPAPAHAAGRRWAADAWRTRLTFGPDAALAFAPGERLHQLQKLVPFFFEKVQGDVAQLDVIGRLAVGLVRRPDD